MTFYRYSCRSVYPLAMLQPSALPAGLTLNMNHPWPVDRVVTDDPKYRDLPLWQRPRAKALNRLLRAGDELYIAWGEFSGCATSMAAFYHRSAHVLQGWHARGIRLHILELPAECDMAAFITSLEALASAERTWEREAEIERASVRGSRPAAEIRRVNNEEVN